MIEAVKLWNEPNNKSHWDFEIDPEWTMFARMATLAGDAVRAENATLTRVLGGMSPIDAGFVRNMQEQARPTTATSTWASCARTAPPSSP